jgi:hypothetical protein
MKEQTDDHGEFDPENYKQELVKAYTKWRDNIAANLAPVEYPHHAWVVFAGLDTQTPQAAFTNREYAEILSAYMQGAIEPILVPREEITLEVDKYLDPVRDGKQPFEVILNDQGELFDAWSPEDGMPNIVEPSIAKNGRKSLSGTFWGWDKFEAIRHAESYWKELHQAGKI